MIKKKLIVFFIILISLLLFAHRPFFAQELTSAPEAPKESSASSIVKYDLAYPGILPDHPLYKLKLLRDKITLYLISDPRKKIDYYLLQTDKGILATAMLVDKKEFDLANQTALKAENNFTLLSSTYDGYYFKENGKIPDQQELLKKLKTASLKHQEVLTSLLEKTPKEKQTTFLQVIDFSKRNMESIEKTKERYEASQMAN